MNNTRNHYIKYSRAELEHYTKQPASCVKKINCVEPIRYSPTVIADFQQSILRILSKKIGKFDMKLNGIVLDFRNTKILATQSAIRQDSPFTIINVAADFYVFSPQRGAVVTGTVKYINRKGMETTVSVVIYRVFNVKVTVKGKVKHELERNHDIKIRVKDFNFDNVIPYIEGEIFDTGMIEKGSTKKLFDDMIDSGISESSVTSVVLKKKDLARRSDVTVETVKIKQERASSVESNRRQSEVKKKRKRKTSSDSDSLSTPIVKKIKVEPMSSTDDELESFQGISNARYLEEPSSSTTKKTTKHDKSLRPSTSTRDTSKHQTDPNTKVSDNESTSNKEKKSKKKKKRKLQDVDDFETSLQLLLNPINIKKEK